MRRQKERTDGCRETSAGDLIKAVRALQSEAALSITPPALSYSFVCRCFAFDAPPRRSDGLPEFLKPERAALQDLL